jgi:Tol biopolymer transport system component
VAAVGGGVVLVVRSSDGSFHLVIDSAKGGSPRSVTDDAAYSESSPSPSPNGSAVVFSRVGAGSPDVTFGIWVVNVDGTGLTNLSLDGYSPRWIA